MQCMLCIQCVVCAICILCDSNLPPFFDKIARNYTIMPPYKKCVRHIEPASFYRLFLEREKYS